MYLRHFALTRLPFETPTHTDELFESNARREAEARLHHLIELKGIGLLTGEVGSGKTTVCRHVAAALHPGLYRVGYVSLTTGNVLDMYKSAYSGEADHRIRSEPITESGQVDHVSERSDVGVRLCRSVIGLGQWSFLLSHRSPFNLSL